jgi:hypothetical protein
MKGLFSPAVISSNLPFHLPLNARNLDTYLAGVEENVAVDTPERNELLSSRHNPSPSQRTFSSGSRG